MRQQKMNFQPIRVSPSCGLISVYVAVPKQNTEYQYWKHTEVSLPV